MLIRARNEDQSLARTIHILVEQRLDDITGHFKLNNLVSGLTSCITVECDTYGQHSRFCRKGNAHHSHSLERIRPIDENSSHLRRGDHLLILLEVLSHFGKFFKRADEDLFSPDTNQRRITVPYKKIALLAYAAGSQAMNSSKRGRSTTSIGAAPDYPPCWATDKPL